MQIALGWDLSFTKCVGSVISKKAGRERTRKRSKLVCHVDRLDSWQHGCRATCCNAGCYVAWATSVSTTCGIRSGLSRSLEVVVKVVMRCGGVSCCRVCRLLRIELNKCECVCRCVCVKCVECWATKRVLAIPGKTAE